jgi:hypothetical protein
MQIKCPERQNSAPVPSCVSLGGRGADGFEVLLPLGAGLFLTGMKWFSTPGVEVRLGFAAMEVEISGEAAIKSCTPLVEFLGVFCLSITIPLPTGPVAGEATTRVGVVDHDHELLGHQVPLGVERRTCRKAERCLPPVEGYVPLVAVPSGARFVGSCL